MDDFVSNKDKITTTEENFKNLKGQDFVDFCKVSIIADEVLQTYNSPAGIVIFVNVNSKFVIYSLGILFISIKNKSLNVFFVRFTNYLKQKV